MAEHWQSLIANLAVVALFISTWVHGQFVFNSGPYWRKRFAFGIVMGLGAVASMMLAIPIDGSLFDLRLSLVAISGFFGGPIAAAATVGIASFYRIAIVGGPNALLAPSSMVLVALAAYAVSRATRHRVPPLVSAAALSLVPLVISLSWGYLLRLMLQMPAMPLSTLVAVMNIAATGLSAFFIMRYRVVERERDLLRAAFIQSPDYQYVKTRNSRFAAVNANVARINGFAAPAQMLGKTDLDIAERDHAEALIASEQALLAAGIPVIDVEEVITDSNGEDNWYLTSKVPLHSRSGEIVGLAGVTRDITAAKRLRHELTESRNQLNYVLSEITDGIAMYDSQGTLAYCNEQFSTIFPLTAAVRRRGQNIRDILRAVVETREQKGIPESAEASAAWVNAVAKGLQESSGREIELVDGRWLHIKTRPTADGSSLVVVSDITSVKQAEMALRSMTERLKLLATTDGLTGLINRRAFDEALETEASRSTRSGAPLSLLMIDVDRFKSYNDLYGHQAGDEVLKVVGQCLKATLKRPADLAARYGGEEFVVILPDTNEDGAFFIADAFRESLKQLAIPHQGGDKKVVTASVGIAVTSREEPIAPAELLHRADEALYTAKHAGRDRVTGWRRPRPIEVRA
jgi:diguanylate cyclase (GGDEF)-like protein/PAS domain S-box-containing protein